MGGLNFYFDGSTFNDKLLLYAQLYVSGVVVMGWWVGGDDLICMETTVGLC